MTRASGNRTRRAAFLATAAICLLSLTGAGAVIPALPIPSDGVVASASEFIGDPATAHPITVKAIPQHPFMAANGASNIHGDAWMTDTSPWSGPLGNGTTVTSMFDVAECASVTFDARGRIVTICVGVHGPTLVLMAPRTLEILALMSLPLRQPEQVVGLFSNFSGGGYFYLDNEDHVVLPTNDRRILVVAETEVPLLGFRVEKAYDLTAVVPSGEGIESVLPDWNGLLWFITEKGLVGTVDRLTGAVKTMRLGEGLPEGEAIGNSFAVDETRGVFIVSDHAMYRFDADEDGSPVVTWREGYDRGTRLKTGQVNFGSGTTPTVFGNHLVAITDNADPMNVLVFRAKKKVDGERLVCTVPVFGDMTGATDNSIIAVGNSLIVENNYGYAGPTSVMNGAVTEPGFVRIDVDEETESCPVVWTNDEERAPSVVSKVSIANGIIYTYTKGPSAENEDPWYLTALDFDDRGKVLFKRLGGHGLGYNNNWAPVTIGPDGTAYVGVLGGLLAFRDS